MSVNITYKNNTLTSFANNTKILKTSGKYMEDDITIIDDSAVGTITISNTSNNISNSYVTFNNTNYYTKNNEINFNPGDTLNIHAGVTENTSSIYINNKLIIEETDNTNAIYNLTLPFSNILIIFSDDENSCRIDLIYESYAIADEIEQLPNGSIAHNIFGTNLFKDTVDENHLAYGFTAHRSDGTLITGKLNGGIIEDNILKDVLFIDYNGSIIYQYTKSEFLTLTELPINPTHPGLISQGWNWTLADAKTYVSNYGALVIGQNYTTVDGKTKIYITVKNTKFKFPLNFYTSLKGGAKIDWGDGTSQITTANGNASGKYSHLYESPGNYIVSIEVLNGNISLGYNGANITFISDGTANGFHSNLRVNKIELGNNIATIYSNALNNLRKMESITIPNYITFSNNLNNCYKLSGVVISPNNITNLSTILKDCYDIKFISLPKSITTLAGDSFSSNYSLKWLTIPELTSISGAIANNHYSLEKLIVPGTYTEIKGSFARNNYFVSSITIPSTITAIADYAFTGNVFDIHMLPTTPPTLANARAIDNGATIYVPYSSDHSILEAYKTATNWSSRATYIVEEES